MTSQGNVQGGGGACEGFQIDDVTRTMSNGGGGAPGVPPIQVQTPPPHLAGWLRACIGLCKAIYISVLDFETVGGGLYFCFLPSIGRYEIPFSLILPYTLSFQSPIFPIHISGNVV